MTLASAVLQISLEPPKFKMGHVTMTTPLLRVICYPLLGLDIAYLCTKFDHSSFIEQYYQCCRYGRKSCGFQFI